MYAIELPPTIEAKIKVAIAGGKISIKAFCVSFLLHFLAIKPSKTSVIPETVKNTIPRI